MVQSKGLSLPHFRELSINTGCCRAMFVFISRTRIVGGQ